MSPLLHPHLLAPVHLNSASLTLTTRLFSGRLRCGCSKTQSQTEQDELYARRLLWEEQQLVQAQRVPPGTGQNAPYGWDPERGGAYPTRSGRRSSPPAPGGGRGGSGTPSGPTAPEFQEHISLFAKSARDASKKTFSSIVSKVKAKIQEYDQGRYVQPRFFTPVPSFSSYSSCHPLCVAKEMPPTRLCRIGEAVPLVGTNTYARLLSSRSRILLLP